MKILATARLLISLTIITPMISGCITSFRNLPAAPSETHGIKKSGDPLYYSVEGAAGLGGPRALKEEIAASALYSQVRRVENPTNAGDYLAVKIESRPPSSLAAGFGLLSYITLTAIPCWSTEDGYTLTFTLTKNGGVARTKEYELPRTTFVWLPMLPFAWINLMTTSEEDAFKAAVKDFLRGPQE